MGHAPGKEVLEAFLAPVVNIVRRIEIYDFDGETPWRSDLWDDILIEGTVSSSNDGDERRNMECTLDNSEGDLDPKVGGLWYDKVFKVFYGIQLDQQQRAPRVLIAEEYESVGQALALKSVLADGGLTQVDYNPQVFSFDEMEDYDVIVSIASDHTHKLSLLNEAFQRGKSILTFGLDATQQQLPFAIGGAAGDMSSDSGNRRFTNLGLEGELGLGWDSWTIIGPQLYRKILAPSAGGKAVATTEDDTNGISPGIVMREEFSGARWMHVTMNNFMPMQFVSGYSDFVSFLNRTVNWLDAYTPQEVWETQIGEFVADRLSDANEYGDQIKVTARDYTKRCLKSRLPAATMHTKDTPIEQIIRTHAVLSGIRKINLPITNITLDKDTTWERDTERWTIMKEIATANNFDIYFDGEGWLRLTPFNDPSTTPPTLVLRTGLGGNLVSRTAATSDSSLFNHVVVVGESSDSSTQPVWAEVKNENPNSPSNIAAIGDRVKVITSSLITTPQQALDLANSMLSVSALEEFEMDFASVLFPWVDAGDIIEMDDPDSEYWGPSRFLLSTLTFPLDLSPMSGTGKRVINVG